MKERLMKENSSKSFRNLFQGFNTSKGKSDQYSNEIKDTFITQKLLEKNLLEALEAGIASGFVDDFDPKKHLKELHTKHL